MSGITSPEISIGGEKKSIDLEAKVWKDNKEWYYGRFIPPTSLPVSPSCANPVLSGARGLIGRSLSY